MIAGKLDVNHAIEAAKKRLNASIYGHKQMPVRIHSGKLGLVTKVTVGEYELMGVACIDIQMKHHNLNVINLETYADSIDISGMAQGTSGR